MLFQADTFSAYLLGQLLLELRLVCIGQPLIGCSLNCDNVSSGRGYALVRSADALGIGMGPCWEHWPPALASCEWSMAWKPFA